MTDLDRFITTAEAFDRLEKLHVEPTDIIVLRGVTRLQASEFCRACAESGWPYHNPVLFLHEGQQIETVSEERMRAIGYERVKES
jgi:hypothetical protein